MRCAHLLVVLGVLGQLGACEHLDFKKVHLVDKVGNNLVFRGNMPVNDTSFALDALLNMMRNRSAEAGVTLPSNFRLIDVTLNNVFDYDSKEIDFWKKAPSSFGELIKWVMGFNGVVSPHDIPDPLRRTTCQTGVEAIDGLESRVEKLFAMLQEESSVVIYVHCSGGCDRTGEFFAGYRLLKGDFRHGRPGTSPIPPQRNISEIYMEDVVECGRPPNYFATTALKWFCYCQSYKGMNIVGGPRVADPICSHFASCKTFGDCVPAEEVVV